MLSEELSSIGRIVDDDADGRQRHVELVYLDFIVGIGVAVSPGPIADAPALEPKGGHAPGDKIEIVAVIAPGPP